MPLCPLEAGGKSPLWKVPSCPRRRGHIPSLEVGHLEPRGCINNPSYFCANSPPSPNP